MMHSVINKPHAAQQEQAGMAASLHYICENLCHPWQKFLRSNDEVINPFPLLHKLSIKINLLETAETQIKGERLNH